MKIDPITFLDRVAEYTQDSTQTSADKPMRLAIIDPAYAGVGLPKIKFDGELTVSGKQYAVMGNYLPAANDRVLLAPVGTTYLILGRVRDTNLYVPPVHPYLHAYQTAAQTMATSGTWYEISMGGEIADTISGHSTTTNNARYTPSQAGTYKCLGVITWAGNITGDRLARFRKNGAEVTTGAAGYMAMSAANTTSAASMAWAGATLDCNGTTDYISLWGQQTSGGSLDTFASGAFTNSFMIIEKLITIE